MAARRADVRCLAPLATAVFVCAATVWGADISITATSAEFPLEDVEVTVGLTVANHGQEPCEVRLRPPHVARLDEVAGVFVPLQSVEVLRIQMDGLLYSLEAGQEQELRIELYRRGPMLAGRYKLLFVAEDQRTGKRVTTGCVFFKVPTRIVMGPPDVVILDVIEDPDCIEATVQFGVETNVSAIRLAVVASDLRCQAYDGSELRLILDDGEGAHVITRGQLRPESVHLAFNSTAALGDDLDAVQSEWAELSAGDAGAVQENIFVQLRWRKDRREILPSGSYEGQVKLLLIPMPQQ